MNEHELRATEMRRRAYGAAPGQFPGTHQQPQIWPAGDLSRRTVLDLPACASSHLWDVALHGENVHLEIRWGTCSQLEVNAALPFRAGLPGKVQVFAYPRSTAGARVVPVALETLGPPVCRAQQVYPTAGALPEYVTRVRAVVASTLTVAGQAVALVAGAEMAIAGGADLLTGVVIGTLEL